MDDISDRFIPNGKKIQRRRQELVMSQEELFEKSGISVRTIQRVEKDNHSVHPHTLRCLAEALQVQPEELIVSVPEGGESSSSSPWPYDFDSLIWDRNQGFVGRQFVRDAIDEFLGQQVSGYFVLEAQPGMGKSAFMANLVVERRYAIHHFNSSGLGIVTTKQFLENMTLRISQACHLPLPEVPSRVEDYGAFLVRILGQASRALSEGQQLVLVVDALDEADVSETGSQHNALFLPSVLPAAVFVVASTRDARTTVARFACRRLFTLDASDPLNRADVEEYLGQWAARERMAACLKRMRISVRRFVETMSVKSHANFMYLRYVLPEIENDTSRSLYIDAIPDGLEAYYEDHWRRMGMSAGVRTETKLKVLYILASLNRAVPQELLVHWSGLSALEVQDVLDEWRPFLAYDMDHEGACVSLYQCQLQGVPLSQRYVESGGDGLAVAGRNACGSHEEGFAGMIEVLAARLARMSLAEKKCRLDQLVRYLGDVGGDWDNLARLFTSLPLLEAKVEVGLVSGLIADCDHIASNLKGDHPDRAVFSLFEVVLRRHAHILRDRPDLLFQCFWNGLVHYCGTRATGISAGTRSAAFGQEVSGRVRTILRDWAHWKTSQSSHRWWLRLLLSTETAGVREVATFLTGHTARVRVLAKVGYKSIASVGEDNTCRKWLMGTGSHWSCIAANVANLRGKCLSPNGALLITTEPQSHVLMVRDASTGMALRPLCSDHSSVQGVVFSSDSRVLVSWSGDGSVQGWDPLNGEKVFEYRVRKSHGGQVGTVAYCQEERLLACALGTSVEVVAIEDLRRIGVLSGYVLPCKELLFLRKSNVLCVITEPGTALLWRYRDGPDAITWLYENEASGGVINGNRTPCVFIRDLGSLDNIFSGSRTKSFLHGNRTDEITCAAVSSLEDRIVLGTRSGAVMVYDADPLIQPLHFDGYPSSVSCIGFAGKEDLVVSGRDDGTILAHNVTRSGACLTIERECGMECTAVAFTTDGSRMLAGSHHGTLHLWDCKTWEPLHHVFACFKPISMVLSARKDSVIACCTHDGSFQLWDGALESRIVDIKPRTDKVAFDSDTGAACFVDRSGMVHVWHAETGMKIMRDRRARGKATVICVSRGSRYVALGDVRGWIRVWDTWSNSVLVRYKAHAEGIAAAVFSGDTELLITSSWDRTVTVWDWAHMKVLAWRRVQAVVHDIVMRYTDDVAIVCWQRKVLEWYWRSGDIVEYQGIVDVSDIVYERDQIASVRGGELVIVTRSDGTVLARWPHVHSKYASHPSRPLWAAIRGGMLDVFELRDGRRDREEIREHGLASWLPEAGPLSAD